MPRPKDGHYPLERKTRTENGGSTTLSPALHEQLVEMRRTKRLFDTQIAHKCKVDHRTLMRWLEQGLSSNAKEPYKTFAEEYITAAIEQEDAAVEQVLKGENGKHGSDWRATAWWLGQRHPRRWGDKQPETGPEEDIDVQRLLEQGQQREQTLNELLSNPPPELEAALHNNRDAILALLGADHGQLLEVNSEAEAQSSNTTDHQTDDNHQSGSDEDA